jgi:hypothetical protein
MALSNIWFENIKDAITHYFNQCFNALILENLMLPVKVSLYGLWNALKVL